MDEVPETSADVFTYGLFAYDVHDIKAVIKKQCSVQQYDIRKDCTEEETRVEMKWK